jgi:gamma-glutamyltranspeptidase
MPIFAVPELVAVKDGKAVFAASGSGGYRITTAILQALSYWHDFGMSLAEAVAAPRLHCQGKETYVDARIPAEVRDGRAALGHKIVVQQDDPGLNAFGRISAVARRGGRLQAVSGPPWLGGSGSTWNFVPNPSNVSPVSGARGRGFPGDPICFSRESTGIPPCGP